MTALPTPEEVARECYDEALDKIAAVIRADRTRVIEHCAAILEREMDAGGYWADRLRREIEEPG